MADEVISKEPQSAEGIEFQYKIIEVVADLHRLAAFESQGTPYEVEILNMPGFFSTLVRLWFHILCHGGSPAALRGISHSLIVFNSIDSDNMDNFRRAIREIDLVLQDIPNAASLFITHILRTIEIACHDPTLVTVLMARLTSSKLTYELGNTEDTRLDKHIQVNIAESCFILCIKLLEICIGMGGLPCIAQILRGRLLPTCFKAALFLGPRSRPFHENIEVLCFALFRTIATFSIYPKVMHLVIKSNKRLEVYGLKDLVKSTVPELWMSRNTLYDTVIERYTAKPNYFVLPRRLCNNPQCSAPIRISVLSMPNAVKAVFTSTTVLESARRTTGLVIDKSAKSLVSARDAGEPMRVNTLYQDFAEWMVDLDLPRFLADTKEIRQRLEEKRAMTEPYRKYPMVVEVSYNSVPIKLGRVYPGEEARTTGIGRMPEVMAILEKRRGHLNEVFFYVALPSGTGPGAECICTIISICNLFERDGGTSSRSSEKWQPFYNFYSGVLSGL
ncbi:hypothetical protein IW262DRAFT_1299020 [Armillaria fumosa]|nr:hypothetical protein IW262DRAFT_1299020 [Armillaria fumosa]